MDTAGLDWERAGEALKQRRMALGYTQVQAAALDEGIGEVTWGHIERGRNTRELQRAAAERVVGWKTGTLERIAKGEPVPTDDADDDALSDDIDFACSVLSRVADRLRARGL